MHPVGARIGLYSPTAPADGSRTGHGSAHGHHGELLQGMFATPWGPRRGLTTLACDQFRSAATVVLDPDATELSVDPGWRIKARDAAARTLAALEAPVLGGTLHVTNNMTAGCGFGSSTGDVIAAIRAALDAFGTTMEPEVVAAIAIDAETASDPIMYDRSVLFAHRNGTLIEDFGMPLPRMQVLGFPLGTRPVDTVEMAQAEYGDAELAEFAVLRTHLRAALRSGDRAGVGQVATRSATINQRHLPVPMFPAFQDVGASCGALGIQVAHSGNVGGLLFDADANPVGLDTARDRLVALGTPETWTFHAGTAGPRRPLRSA